MPLILVSDIQPETQNDQNKLAVVLPKKWSEVAATWRKKQYLYNAEFIQQVPDQPKCLSSPLPRDLENFRSSPSMNRKYFGSPLKTFILPFWCPLKTFIPPSA